MLITSGRVCYKRRKGGWGPGGRARLRTGKKFLLDNHYDGGEDHHGDGGDDHGDGEDHHGDGEDHHGVAEDHQGDGEDDIESNW